MQFQVPQFIEVEDKIFGPLTFKQFIYVAGGLGMMAIIFFYLPSFLAYPLMAIVGGFSSALAFYKVNNKPFIELVEAAFKYSVKNKLYIWKKVPKKVNPQTAMADIAIGGGPIDSLLSPRLSDSKLKDLAWSLDVSDKMTGETVRRNIITK